MAELVPLPIERLATRMFRELERDQAIFDLPERKFVRGLPGRDVSVRFHGHAAASPLGPAAGPHSQLAQNIVLAFLGGGRIFELKTVQIQDRLTIPRPCIDAQTVGYNVEWSQELTLEQSLEEYVKASMLIDLLVASGRLGLAPGFERYVFDMSVGYDLAGIQSERVQRFLHGMMDARAVIERLRARLPAELGSLRDLPFRERLSDTLTLSTFHGCPPDEIERIGSFLLEHVGLHTIVKLNPTLLGKQEVRRLLHDVLGYPDQVPDTAFDKDATWDQAVEFVGRLGEHATRHGRHFGVKFSNTLIVENHRDFFPASERVMYLSGQPLHVLAMRLVQRFRSTFGDAYPVSFSGGIDQKNFPDAVSLGLVPVTVCTDLLRTGGYARMSSYFRELDARMSEVGATSLDDFILAGRGLKTDILAKLGLAGAQHAAVPPERQAEATSLARRLNTDHYVDGLVRDARYTRAATNKPPKKVGTRLSLFDCLTCDKCVPVCPNDANFTYTLPSTEVAVLKATRAPNGTFEVRREGTVAIAAKHQLANFADFCNECGNCDIFCPEDGGPYVLKPRFFGSREQFDLHASRDGFFLERTTTGAVVLARFAGRRYSASFDGELASYSGDGFAVRCRADDPSAELSGQASVEVDLTYVAIMGLMRRVLLDASPVNYLNA